MLNDANAIRPRTSMFSRVKADISDMSFFPTPPFESFSPLFRLIQVEMVHTRMAALKG